VWFLRRRDRGHPPGVEGRVKIDEVDRLVLDVALEDFVVVAVVEPVFLSGHRNGMRVTQG
jgi:hypothetical protein